MECSVSSWSHSGVPQNRDGTKFFFMGWDGTKSLWDGSSQSHAKPGPGRDGTRPWWDGSSHPGPAVSLDDWHALWTFIFDVVLVNCYLLSSFKSQIEFRNS